MLLTALIGVCALRLSAGSVDVVFFDGRFTRGAASGAQIIDGGAVLSAVDSQSNGAHPLTPQVVSEPDTEVLIAAALAALGLLGLRSKKGLLAR